MSGFDATGVPIGADCPAMHPETGNRCVEVEGHDGPHYAKGTLRMQMFGPFLECSPVATPQAPEVTP